MAFKFFTAKEFTPISPMWHVIFCSDADFDFLLPKRGMASAAS